MRGVGSFLMSSFNSLREIRLCNAAMGLKFDPGYREILKIGQLQAEPNFTLESQLSRLRREANSKAQQR